MVGSDEAQGGEDLQRWAPMRHMARVALFPPLHPFPGDSCGDTLTYKQLGVVASLPSSASLPFSEGRRCPPAKVHVAVPLGAGHLVAQVGAKLLQPCVGGCTTKEGHSCRPISFARSDPSLSFAHNRCLCMHMRDATGVSLGCLCW